MSTYIKPKPTHIKIILWVVAISLLLLGEVSHADILTSMGDDFKRSSVQWQPRLLEVAKSLFWKLAFIEFAWASILWGLKNSEMQSFVSSVVQKIIGIGFFYMLLQNADYWIPAIINSLTKSGQIATGLKELTPSEIFDTGINTAVAMLNGVKSKSVWEDFAVMIVGGWSAIFIVIAFLVIAGQMLIALIESYIVIGGGILFLGFGGSRWTTDFTQKYISYAFATGVKLFMLYLIVGIGSAQAQNWATLLNDVNFNNIFEVLGGSLLLGFLGFQIPNMASSMLSGSPSLTAGSALGTGAAVAAGTVAAGAGAVAGASGAIQSARGGMQALKASYDYHRAGGSNPLSSALKAPLTSTLDMGREALGIGKKANNIGGAAATYRENQTTALKERNAASTGGGSTGSDSSGNFGSGNTPHPPSDNGTSPTGSGGPGVAIQDGIKSASEAGVANIAGGSPTISANKSDKQSNAEKSASVTKAGSSATLPQDISPGKRPFESLKRVRPPQIPHDGAPSATIHIKLGHSED